MLDFLKMKFSEITKTKSLLFSLALLSLLLLTSCEQKKTEETVLPKDTAKVEMPMAVDTLAQDTSMMKEPEVVIPDVKGKWTGTFDKRTTTLRITEQDGKSFKGKITINYREVINQQVSGMFDEESMEFTMKDLLHSRYAGTYKGKFSADMKSLSGTFTQNVEKTKFTFSLKKQ
jgi:PBP1b-binding outer membrane lipoprotein LpoB